MMGYEAKIIADSVSPSGARLTTFQVRCPTMIWQEMLTHRLFSRNASSTRAIPLARQIRAVMSNPALPVVWTEARRGMQAWDELDDCGSAFAVGVWVESARRAAESAETLSDLGVHKQDAGRLLAPFGFTDAVITSCASGLLNFFALRCHPDADPKVQAVAVPMARSYRDSTPHRLEVGWWHLPYATPDELAELCRLRGGFAGSSRIGDFEFDLIRRSAARCARVSYLNHDATAPDPARDAGLHDRLLASGHLSPMEHQGRCLADADERSGNFRGWLQYRQVAAPHGPPPFDWAGFEARYPAGTDWVLPAPERTADG